jgi:hypothetical protein
MNCVEFRRAIGADPQHPSEDAVAHRRTCVECAQYERSMLDLDGKLRRALEVPVPESAPFASPVVASIAPAPERRWYALAASVLLALVVGFAIWLSAPSPLQAADIVAHLRHAPRAMDDTSARVDPGMLDGVLGRAGILLDPLSHDVSFAETCPIGKRWVPHLVVQTANGPVTVIVLPDDHVKREQPFDEGGYRGVLVPSGKGALAVLMPEGKSDPAIVHDAAMRVNAAITWKD